MGPLEQTCAALAHDQRRLGVSAETHQCHWDGRRPDYGTAIEVLDGWAKVRGEDEEDGDVSAET